MFWRACAQRPKSCRGSHRLLSGLYQLASGLQGHRGHLIVHPRDLHFRKGSKSAAKWGLHDPNQQPSKENPLVDSNSSRNQVSRPPCAPKRGCLASLSKLKEEDVRCGKAKAWPLVISQHRTTREKQDRDGPGIWSICFRQWFQGAELRFMPRVTL